MNLPHCLWEFDWGFREELKMNDVNHLILITVGSQLSLNFDWLQSFNWNSNKVFPVNRKCCCLPKIKENHQQGAFWPHLLQNKAFFVHQRPQKLEKIHFFQHIFLFNKKVAQTNCACRCNIPSPVKHDQSAPECPRAKKNNAPSLRD